MNILFLTYQGGVAGSTLSISYLCRALSKRGHTVVMGCRPDTLLWQLLEDSTVVRVPMQFRSRWDRSTMRVIRDTVRSYKIDLINAQSTKDRYLAILCRWLYRLDVRLVHTRRQMPRMDGGIAQALLYRFGTDKIIAVSKAVKLALEKAGIPGRHIAVIYNGTPVEKYTKLDTDRVEKLRRELDIRPNDFVIGCLARRKKQEQILQALPLLGCTPKVLFVGIEEHELHSADTHPYTGPATLHFTGSIDPDEALQYIKLFSINVLPSTTEGLSQALLEAMALGVPVVATAAGGNTDLIQDGVNGFLFNDGDIPTLAEKIMHVVNHPAEINTIIETARRTALEQFSLENTACNYETLFSSLLHR